MDSLNSKKILIIGGVAGGATAATRLRRLDENAKIILFERGEFISYANCGLPYHIGNIIRDKEKLILQTPESMKKRYNLDIRIRSEVQKINPIQKIIEIQDLERKTKYTESYDFLILSPGASPLHPSIEGISLPNVFTLRNIPDMDTIKTYINENHPIHATVVGGGYIGLEIAENLSALGIKITIIELANQVMAPLDFEMAAIVHQHLRDKDIELYLNDGIQKIEDTFGITNVFLQSGKQIKTNLVILGIGVKPEVKLAKEASLSIGERGGIKVNQSLQTSDPNIYAIGDAIEVEDFVNHNPALIPLAGPANKQARIAANNIYEAKETYEGTQGSSIARIFDLTIATTGNNEKLLKRFKIPYIKSFTHSVSHAGYFPGSIPLSIEMFCSPDNGKILGAQIVGYDGVDKRIDIIATALRANLSVSDLEKLELAYAPPYSSAKDPVNITGYVANNILKNDTSIIHWNDIEKLDKFETLILDVRTKTEFSLGKIPNAINIPLDDLRNHFQELPKDKKIVIYCQVGLRGYIGERILRAQGFNVVNLSGGYKTWKTATEKQTNEGIFSDLKILSNDEIRATYSLGGGKIMDFEKEKFKPKISIDAMGLRCPGPLLKLAEGISRVNMGEIIKISASDPGFVSDLKVWTEKTNNELITLDQQKGEITALIKRGFQQNQIQQISSQNNAKTMVIFDGDLDHALAAFIIANGAITMGRKVTMFFTFWGLNILRKPGKIKLKKKFIEKMFEKMLPQGSSALILSRMHMKGMGTKMIKKIMKQKNIPMLEELIQQAITSGVRLVACNMTMDLMGIKPEELLDGVELGGVATFLGSTDESNMSLFI